MDRWVGKLAIVTGASSGIGAEIATALVTAGLQVVGLARRNDRVEALAKQLNGRKGKLHAFKCDITIESNILDAFKWAIENLGPIHILINNSGIYRQSPLISGSTKDWIDVMHTNVIGLCVATREAVQDMMKNNVAGHIVHINSIAGHRIIPDYNIYTASKSAVTVLTEVLRQELRLANTKIKITSVSPGYVHTEITSFASEEIRNHLHAGPRLEEEDVANAVLYALGTPPHVQIHEVTIKPLGEYN